MKNKTRAYIGIKVNSPNKSEGESITTTMSPSNCSNAQNLGEQFQTDSDNLHVTSSRKECDKLPPCLAEGTDKYAGSADNSKQEEVISGKNSSNETSILSREFNLSKRERVQFIRGVDLNLHYFKISDVKEFIRLLGEIADKNAHKWGTKLVHINDINKLAGGKLI